MKEFETKEQELIMDKYMGHELDIRKCDIVAEINAKEKFFTDDFGTESDGSIYIADPSHPMAKPETQSVR